MKQKRIRIAAVLCAALLTAGLSACGTPDGGGESSPKSAASGLPEVTVTDKKITVLSQSNADSFTQTTELVKGLYGVEPEYISVAWTDLGTKVAQLVLGGTPPDVYFSRTRDFPLLAKKNVLEPLDDILDFSHTMFEGCEANLAEVSFENKIYAAPTRGNVGHVLWYNESLFKAAGLETPRELYEKGAWDWNSYLNAAIELTDANEGIYGRRGTSCPGLVAYDRQGCPVL